MQASSICSFVSFSNVLRYSLSLSLSLSPKSNFFLDLYQAICRDLGEGRYEDDEKEVMQGTTTIRKEAVLTFIFSLLCFLVTRRVLRII